MHRRTTISEHQEVISTLAVKLMVYEFHQDDPRKCTSAKLCRFQLARKLKSMNRIHRSSIVLNPTASQTLSRDDKPIAKQYGLVALDCSWNLSEEIFQRQIPGENRRLPALLAGNPTSYGIIGRLSTAEAFAAALYITGFPQEAEKVLTIFNWGHTFLSLNEDPLQAYAGSAPDEMAEREREFFGHPER